VDIDAQAVEVTKLSLLLKVLEGETAASTATQLAFVHERALPDLGNNIKCGNSLSARTLRGRLIRTGRKCGRSIRSIGAGFER
jgi:hypothetical protein